MATSLLALIDDIATVLDDVSVMTKVAVKKTAAVLGDDLALNAQQVTGVCTHRELPVVWAVAKGSIINKFILVPAALIISAIAPWAVTPLLMFGGAFLCYEGMEKIAHKFLHKKEPREDATAKKNENTLSRPPMSADQEKQKIKGAIRTDFVLSAEIVVITLGTVATQPFGKRLAVLCAIAAIMTVGVYGLVAGIVKLDDAGLALSTRSNAMARRVGLFIVSAAPWMLKGLSILGTAAMFLVGGEILTHGVDVLHHWSVHLTEGISEPLRTLCAKLIDGLIGIVLGASVLGLVSLWKRFFSKSQAQPWN